ncbi:MAG: hypothetical protein ACOCYP_06335 [Planctomycetota bacterium]
MRARRALPGLVILLALGACGEPVHVERFGTVDQAYLSAKARPATDRFGSMAVAHPSDRKLERPRLLGPRLVAGDGAGFHVALPGEQLDGRPEQHTLQLQVDAPGHSRSDTITFSAPRGLRIAQAAYRAGDRAEPPDWHLTGDVAIALSDWPDGPATARLFARDGTVLDSCTFTIDRARLARVADPADRAELAVWIADANRPDPIWGKLPRWSNLDRALDRPTARGADCAVSFCAPTTTPSSSDCNPTPSTSPAPSTSKRPAPC